MKQTNLRYQIAPNGWEHTDPNPFSPDGSYGSEWSAFCLLDREDDQFFTGKSGDGPFSACFGRMVDHLEDRLANFLCYENRHGRTVILSFPQDIDIHSYVVQALSSTPKADIVRPEDPAVLVHATTQAAWQSIRGDCELKAASQLGIKRYRSDEGSSSSLLEDYLKHEPPEYSDYIMFSGMESCVPEMVVASNQKNRFVLDENAIYEPGVRLYFDNYRIIRNGLGVRDGLHLIKVYQRLALQPYLLATIDANDIDPQHEKQWAIKEFTEKANVVFRDLVNL
jgi:hypothetical protein